MSFSLLSHDGVAGAEHCWMQPGFAFSQPGFAIEKTLRWVLHISNGQNNRASIDKSGFFVKKRVFSIEKDELQSQLQSHRQ